MLNSVPTGYIRADMGRDGVHIGKIIKRRRRISLYHTRRRLRKRWYTSNIIANRKRRCMRITRTRFHNIVRMGRSTPRNGRSRKRLSNTKLFTTVLMHLLTPDIHYDHTP